MADQDLSILFRQRGYDVNGIGEILYAEVTPAMQDGAIGEKAIFAVPKGFKVVDAYVDVTAGTGTTHTDVLILDDGSNKTVITGINGVASALTRMITGGQQAVTAAAAGFIKLNMTVITAITVQPTFRVYVLGIREQI